MLRKIHKPLREVSSMDSLFHLVFAFIGGLAIGLHRRHSVHVIGIIALTAVALDVDHFFHEGLFHTLWITLVIPLILFLIAFYYERHHNSICLQTYVLLLMVMVNGHLLADLFNGDTLLLLYPFSSWTVSLQQQYASVAAGTVVSGDGVATLIYAGVILLGRWVENYIYFFERQHLKIEKALCRGVLQDV